MDANYEKLNATAELLKVLAHPVRLCIIKGLLEKGQCNVTYMQSCLKMPQSTVSQHLQKLKAAGVVESTRSGLEVYYHIADEKVIKLIKVLLNIEN